MTSLRLIGTYIDSALDRLPKAPAGTPDAREIEAIQRFLLMAKARLKSIERRPDPAGSTEWGR